MAEYLKIGYITAPFGNKGEVKVHMLTDFPERFEELEWAYIDSGSTMEKYDIEQVRFIKGSAVIKFKGIQSISDAEKIRNNYIKVKREDAYELPEGHYYISDLIDCDVYTTEDRFLGKVKDVIKTGANDVFKVIGDKEVLIPIVKEFVEDIDLNNKKILIKPIEGLIE